MNDQNKAGYEKLLAEIAQDEDHGYYEKLHTAEAGIDWLGFAAKLYRRSHSASTVTSYCKGICEFKAMRANAGKTLVETIADIKAQANGLAYKLLDDFVTHCDSRELAPRTTRNYFQAITRLFDFLEIDLDERKLKNISMPRPKAVPDETPSNEALRKIDSALSHTLRGYFRVIADTGFEPVDAAMLKVQDFKFNEDPVRINKDRKKTGESLEGFLSKDTVVIIKQIIANGNKQADDFVFTDSFNGYSMKSIRDRYNKAVAVAGFGSVKRRKNKQGTATRAYAGTVDKIPGHKFGKFHLKVLKKRWFTLVISAGVPEYVAQGMLGRRRYLDQYMRLPLADKQEFARKILKIVDINADKVNQDEIRKHVANAFGLDDVTPQQIAALRGLLKMATMPNNPLSHALSAMAKNNTGGASA